MKLKLFNNRNIDIKPYLNGYKRIQYKPVKKYNSINNTIVCTEKVAKEIDKLMITKDHKKNKQYIDFDKVIPIRNRDDFSYEIIRKYWGALPDDEGLIDGGITDDGEYIFWFKTQYLEPIKIIDLLISKYKKQIIWFTDENSIDDNKRGYLFYWNKNHVETMIEHKKTKEEIKQQENENYTLEFFIPYHLVYKGLYLDCYSKDANGEKYICSCEKEALKNKLLMFDDYMVHDYCLNDRKEILLKFLGLPDYYENKIKDAPQPDKYIDYYNLFKFEDDLCPICNGVKQPDSPFYLNNGTSKFKQKYEGEFEKQYSINGLIEPNHVYRGNYCMEELLTPENKKLLNISDEELINEVDEYNLDFDTREELEKFKQIDEETRKAICYSLGYDRKGQTIRPLDIGLQYNINTDFILAIEEVYDERFKMIRKSINKKIHDIDKRLQDYKTLIKPEFGLNIILIRENEVLHIELWTDILNVIEKKGKKDIKTTYKSSIDIFSKVLEILSSDLITLPSEIQTYNGWLICNGKKRELTKEDAAYGDFSSVAINHALIYLMTNIDNKEKIENIFKKWLP